MAQMSINADLVGASVNQISVLMADIDSRIAKFQELVQEGIQKANGKWELMSKLGEKLQEEVANVKKIEESIETVKTAINRYADAMSEVDDASELG